MCCGVILSGPPNLRRTRAADFGGIFWLDDEQDAFLPWHATPRQPPRFAEEFSHLTFDVGVILQARCSQLNDYRDRFPGRKPADNSDLARLPQNDRIPVRRTIRRIKDNQHNLTMNAPMNPNKALWEKGDFTRIAESMRESGEALIQRLGISNGLKVLDLGCGDGTTAIPAAKLGAEVLGVDIASNLVAAGNKRAKELGLANCRFQEGDAANLHQVPEKAFDLVVSIFGAMFAPKPFDVAKEMVRVTRPGGRIIMGNWIPNDPTLVAQILKISSAYTPPPPEGFVSPMTWGIESNVIERFAGAGVPAEKISFARDTFTFNYPSPPAAFMDEFRKYYGPTMNAFEAAEKNGRTADLQKELEELFNRQNQGPRKDVTSIPATFLRITVAL